MVNDICVMDSAINRKSHFTYDRSTSAAGFTLTLVERLVVIAIISVLAGLLLPALEDALGMTRQIACMNSQRQFFLYITAYQEDNRNYYPQSYMWWGSDATVSNHSGGYGEWVTGILPIWA